ncbi:MAG: hypothetical protein Q4D21_02895 [Phascolarctobacterium sp.]|nr:hypothetical protein [Phascolarctobacterium sp.]
MKNKFLAALSLVLVASIPTIGYCAAATVSNKPVTVRTASTQTTSPNVSTRTTTSTQKIAPNKPVLSTKTAASAPVVNNSQGQSTTNQSMAHSSSAPVVNNSQGPKTLPNQVATTKSSINASPNQNAVKSTQAQTVAHPTQNVKAPAKTQAKGKSFPIKQPLPEKYMQAPSALDFQAVVKSAYHLSVPTAFGTDPLTNLPGTDGPMLLRVQDNLLYIAVNVIDPTDLTSFNATQGLPKFAEKKVKLKWVQGTQGKLMCQASNYNSFNGDACLIEASYKNDEKTCELLYSFPRSQLHTYLPLVLYSLNSFQMH